MADALISVVVEQLATFLLDKLKKEVKLILGASKDVQELHDTFDKIRDVLDDAEKRHVKSVLLNLEIPESAWLEKLKDVSYEMEDVLDEWRTKILNSEIAADENSAPDDVDGARTGKKKVWSCFLSPCSCFNKATLHPNIGRRILELKGRLDLLITEKEKYKFEVTRRVDEQKVRLEEERRHTISRIKALEVYGRDLEKEKLISMLLSESSSQVESSVPVVSIVGMGGMGKTTLAQDIFNEDKVVKHFEKKMWVCVSEPFDLKRIAKAIIEAVGDGVPNLTEWEAWDNHLCQSLVGKLFLLVLDDVQTKDGASWDKLKLALDHGKKGSRIVVTTCDNGVAQTVRTTDKHNLEQLSDDDCWLLFEHLAFEGRRGESNCQKLKDIGRKISDRCKGVPLYAKSLGSLMPRKRTVEDWEEVLASDIWKLPTVGELVLPPLLLSYNALPSHLKRCFTYCAVFPKDHRIVKDGLIKMWMAEGCLRSSQTRERESIGAEYFDELVMRSFFQNLEMDMDGNVSNCKMHYLIHDFATFVANNECLVTETSKIKLNDMKARHLSVMASEHYLEFEDRIPVSIWNLKSLRTLLGIWRSLRFEDLTLLSHLTSLRTLDLSFQYGIKKLPKEVEKLIHLRYLDLSFTDVEELSEVVTNLSNLQTLRLNKCFKLRRLPNKIGKLVSLRHLEAQGSRLLELPETISSLSNLQTLKLNGCSNLRRLPDEMGNMVSLQQLEVEHTKLEEVPETISNLSNLQTLKLNRCENLCRLPNDMGKMVSLRHLEFEFVRLECFPRGIGKLLNLETLSEFIVSEEGSDIGELKDLNNLRGSLPISNIKGVGKEASHEAILKDKEYLCYLSLRFNNVDDDEAVKSVLELLEPHPNLEKLVIWNYNGSMFPSWMEFPNWQGRSIMLRQLIIGSCKNLKVLPALGRLEFLEYLNLGQLDSVSAIMGLEVLGVLKNGDISEPVIAFPKLKELSIRNMKHWEEWVIKMNVNITVMPLLQKLTISHCPLLKSLPCQILSNSLREMTIDSCRHLEFSYLPPFLKNLELWNDAGSLSISLSIQNGLRTNLKSLSIWFLPHSTLPQGLSQLKALQTLKVSLCDSLTCIPEELQHLTSLWELEIYECRILGPRCKKEVGEDWSIISHIPNIHIDLEKIQ